MQQYIKAKLLIIDPDKTPVSNGVVILEDEKITYAGPAVEIPAGSPVIDCSEDTVMPALIDTHCHITANSKYRVTLKEQHTLDLPTAVIRGTMNLRSDLEAGVTTMRTLGDVGDVELRFREAIKRGETPGPRLLICIRALRPSHGTAPFLAAAVDGPAEIRTFIRQNFSKGADVVKLFVTNVSNGLTDEDYRRGDLTQVPAYSREELFAAIGEAHNLGMKVTGHAIGGPAMRWAMEAGIDSVEHANMLEEQDIEYFVKYGTRLSDPNLQLFFDPETGFQSRENYKAAWWREKVETARDLTQKYMLQAMRAGVKICLAVDSTHSFLWKEAKYLVEIGASTKEALLAVGKNNAELLGLGDVLGTLEKGKFADIISVKGDPLQDICTLKNVRLVIKQGKVFKSTLEE